MPTEQTSYDVAVIGGGHNGLVAAAYLSRAGLRVVVLERLTHTGGAAVSAAAFPGVETRLSRYSYLVSLLPDRLIAELDLDLRLASRPLSSYTPWRRGGVSGGLLVERDESAATRESFLDMTGSGADYWAWQEFYSGLRRFAGVLAPTLLEPLPDPADLAPQVDPGIWRDVVERPIGEAIRRRFGDDTVRGVIGTDALIGTFASLEAPSLVQNRCFLYHLIGNGTGEWRVPVGGMGTVTDALARAARNGGAEIVTGAEVTDVFAHGSWAEVHWRDAEGREHGLNCGFVLSGLAPASLARLLGQPDADERPEGSQLKINLLLDRLPRLRSGMDPATAFAGTLHLNESYVDLETAHAQAARGELPDRPPGEVYCHTLTDPSILGSDSGSPRHTLTYFGLHTPARLFEENPDLLRAQAVSAAVTSISEHLAEPLMACVATDANGNPCIEAKIPQDLERDLAMPGGHIFHGDLEWPWAPRHAALDTPAQRWGVHTSMPSVLFCGSGARRGGAVSGIGGHNAAMAVLESI